MTAADKEPFLSRWSRRKRAPEKEAAPAKLAASSPVAHAATPPAPESGLPSVDSLKGLASEYKDFLHPQVEDKLRRAALKQLFRDPHFNVMDGLDVYIDDYSKPDPIPEAMLKTLQHAKAILFPEEKGKERSQPAADRLAESGEAASGAPEERDAAAPKSSSKQGDKN